MSDFTLAEHSAILRRAWVTDPPPWRITDVDKVKLNEIYNIKMEALVKVLELEAQAIRIEIDTLRKTAEILR